MGIPLIRGITAGGIMISAALTMTAGTPQAQARYWEILCRGPITGVTADGRQIVLEARAGTRAARPRRGECVWLDRPMNRPGEHVSGRIRLVLPSRARITGVRRLRNGGLSFRMPGHPQLAELAGLLFSPVASPVALYARSIGSGTYAIRLSPAPVAEPAPGNRSRVRARPAPSRSGPYATPAPSERDF